MRNVSSGDITVKSLVSKPFKKQLKKLPIQIQKKVKEVYLLWRKNPIAVRFELKFDNIYAVEVTRDIHAVCRVEKNKTVLWVWVGSYKDYSRYLTDLRRLEEDIEL